MPNVERKSADADQCPEVQGDGLPRDTSTEAETQGAEPTNKISFPADLPPILPHRGSFPSHRQCSYLLEEVQEFDYLGLRLDPKLKMTSALHRIQEKVKAATMWKGGG